MFGIKLGDNKKKVSICGKDLNLDSERDILYLRDLDDGESFAGNPIVSIFENEEKTYDNVSIRLISEDGEDELRLSVNFPKTNYPLVKNLNEDFGFYLNAFNLVKGIALLNGVDDVDADTTAFKEVNFKEILEYVDGLDVLQIQQYLPEDSEYFSFRVTDVL